MRNDQYIEKVWDSQVGMSDTPAIERWLSEDEIDQQLRATERPAKLRRLGFIKNLYQGDSVEDAINREGHTKSTGYRWRRRWNNGGIEAMMPAYSGGRPEKLPADAAAAIREHVDQEQPCSTAELRSLLDSEYNVTYATGYLPRKLKEIGLTYRQPDRTRNTPANLCAEIEWDSKPPAATTARRPYDVRPNSRAAGWVYEP
jgi:putative transposase